MPAENQNYFTPARIAQLRREVEEQGLVTDPFLANDPDCPVFGLNLACAYPFPAAVAWEYNSLAAKLAASDPSVYVYPLWETHVTIATFVNFNLHRQPADPELAKLSALAGRIIHCIQSLKAGSFVLRLHPPILTRKAVIIPISNSNGEIARIRTETLQLIRRDPELHTELLARDLTVPEIIHSTIMRFPRQLEDLGGFINRFQAIAATACPREIEVSEIFLTEETKPYMREGRVLWRGRG
jgi:hypothetical protein